MLATVLKVTVIIVDAGQILPGIGADIRLVWCPVVAVSVAEVLK